MGYENDPYRDEDGEPLMDYDDGFQSDHGDDNNNNDEQHHQLLDDNLADEIEDTDWQSNRESTPVFNESVSKSKPRKRLIKKSTADEPLPDFPVDDDVEDEMAAFVRNDEFSGGGKRKNFSGDGGSGSKRKEKKSSFSKFSEKAGRGGSEKSAMKFKGNSSSKRSGRSGGGDDAEVKEMWDTIAGGDSEKMALKELMEALRFICTVSFWRMVFLWTFPLIISYIKLLNQSIFSKKPIYNHCAVLPLPPITSVSTNYKTSGRRLPICIITGATSGLGAAAAFALSKEGFFVVLAGRSSDKLSKVMSDIRKQNKEAHLEAFQVDLSSFSSIMRFKESLENWLLDSDMHPSVQLLINNAGILATTSGLTSEGHDRMMGTNYVGAFSLTEFLLPLLKKSPIPSRIVNLTSFTHRNVSSFRPERDIISGKCFSELKHYPCAQIYEYSKLCILLFSYELHRQLHLTEGSNPISVMAVDPGAVKTNIMGEVPLYISQVAFFTLRFLGLLQSPEAGISSILDAALAPPGTSGLYFFGGNGRTVDSSALSYNIKLSRELCNTSRDIFNDSMLIYNRISDSSEKVD